MREATLGSWGWVIGWRFTKWVEMLNPAEIAAELGRNFDLLTTDLQDVPERQRTIRGVFDYS